MPGKLKTCAAASPVQGCSTAGDAWKPRRTAVRSTPRAMSASAGGETAHLVRIRVGVRVRVRVRVRVGVGVRVRVRVGVRVGARVRVLAVRPRT
eukprot:scaffold28650_cov56-Phaeocystis_antarctica.AAC.3